METVKNWIASLTEIGLLLLALAIVAALLVGSNLPFFGNITDNLMALVKSLGDAGLVGLITIAIIIWLFSGAPARTKKFTGDRKPRVAASLPSCR